MNLKEMQARLKLYKMVCQVVEKRKNDTNQEGCNLAPSFFDVNKKG